VAFRLNREWLATIAIAGWLLFRSIEFGAAVSFDRVPCSILGELRPQYFGYY